MTALAWRSPELAVPVAAALVVLALGLAVLAAAQGSAGVSVRARLRGELLAAPPTWFAAVARALELPGAPEAIWPWAVRVLAGAAVILALRAPVALLVLLALGLAVRSGLRARDRQAAARALDHELLAVVDDVAAAMASGASLLQALAAAASGQAGTVRTELGLALGRQARGLKLQEVLDDWAVHRPATGIGLLADALALAGASGGSQVAALRSVGDTLREREALQREVGALAAQAQLSAAVLVVTPAAFAAVVAVADHRIAVFLLASPLGWMCLVAGAGLDGAGAWWMRRLVRSVS